MNDPAVTCDPIRLSPGVELISGPNNVPLLYVAGRRSYVRLGGAAAEIAQWLRDAPATRDELADRLSARHGIDLSIGRQLLSGENRPILMSQHRFRPKRLPLPVHRVEPCARTVFGHVWWGMGVMSPLDSRNAVPIAIGFLKSHFGVDVVCWGIALRHL